MRSQDNSKSYIPFKSNSDTTQHPSVLLLGAGVIKRPKTLQTCLSNSLALSFLPKIFGKVTFFPCILRWIMIFWKVSIFTEEAFISVGHEYELSDKVLETNTKLSKSLERGVAGFLLDHTTQLPNHDTTRRLIISYKCSTLSYACPISSYGLI